MTSITRSASLTDLIGKPHAAQLPSSSDKQSSHYGSPQKKPLKVTSLFQQNESLTPLRGSVGKTSLGNWQWLSKTKSFHDVSRVLPPGVSTAAASTSAVGNARKPQRRTVGRYLDHLEVLLPQYCEHVSRSTYQEAAKAMSLLLNSPPPVHFGPGEQNDLPGSPKSLSTWNPLKNNDNEARRGLDMKSLLSSPFRSRKPVRNKLQEENDETQNSINNSLSSSHHGSLGGRNHQPRQPQPQHVTNKLDEEAWQEFVSPLVLLAGAEAIYADLEHVHSSPPVIHWKELYQRIAEQLIVMLPRVDENHESVTHFSPPRENDTIEMGSATLLQHPQSPPASPIRLPPTNLSPRSFAEAPDFLPGADLATASLAITTPTPTNNSYRKAGKSRILLRYKGFCSLIDWLEVKRQWLPFHESIYLEWNPGKLVFLRAFAAAMPARIASAEDEDAKLNAKSKTNDCSQPLRDALEQEVTTTLALMEMAVAMKRGRFLETVVNAHKVKQNLLRIGTQDCALVQWMKTTFQDYLSIIPLVFDRVHAFATPLYRFDQKVLLDATRNERTLLDDKRGATDLDVLVVDFLRRQEKAGGPDVAVAIVLDTSGLVDDDDDENQASSKGGPMKQSARDRIPHRVELGFALQQDFKQQRSAPTEQFSATGRSRSNSLIGRQKDLPASELNDSFSRISVSQSWPAIYLRSTTSLNAHGRGATSVSHGLISDMRRSPNINRGSASALDGMSNSQGAITSGSSRPSWTADAMSPRTNRERNRALSSNGNVLEYESEASSNPSWPHSEWNLLKNLLASRNTDTGPAHFVADLPDPSPIASPHRRGASSRTRIMTEEPSAITFLPGGIDASEAEKEAGGKLTPQALFESGGSLFSTDLPRQLWEPSSNNRASTSFHAVHLSECMWMVVLVKGEDGSRWHRRKSRGLPDEKIRGFLNDMASKLRVSNRFLAPRTCQTARVKVRDPLAPRVRARDLGLREAKFQSDNPQENDEVQDEVLALMKEAFNVSETSPMLNRAESILTTMTGGGYRGGAAGSRSPRERRRILASQRHTGPYGESSNYREGAAWFFLGPALYRQFLESTNE